MQLEFYVVYSLQTAAGMTTIGRTTVTADRPIDTMAMIASVERKIMETIPGSDNLFLISWKQINAA